MESRVNPCVVDFGQGIMRLDVCIGLDLVQVQDMELLGTRGVAGMIPTDAVKMVWGRMLEGYRFARDVWNKDRGVPGPAMGVEWVLDGPGGGRQRVKGEEWAEMRMAMDLEMCQDVWCKYLWYKCNYGMRVDKQGKAWVELDGDCKATWWPRLWMRTLGGKWMFVASYYKGDRFVDTGLEEHGGFSAWVEKYCPKGKELLCEWSKD
jgi:hypothetical protein